MSNLDRVLLCRYFYSVTQRGSNKQDEMRSFEDCRLRFWLLRYDSTTIWTFNTTLSDNGNNFLFFSARQSFTTNYTRWQNPNDFFLRNRLFEWKIVIIGVDTKISIWAKGWDVINACKSKFEVLKTLHRQDFKITKNHQKSGWKTDGIIFFNDYVFCLNIVMSGTGAKAAWVGTMNRWIHIIVFYFE